MTVARKPHVCTLCDLTIPPGADYIYERITPWDHPDNERYFTFKAHRVCERAWRDADELNDGLLPTAGWEFLWDFLGESCPAEGRHRHANVNDDRTAWLCSECGSTLWPPSRREIAERGEVA